ncbi:MAG: hypothetical protein ABI867_13845 [Kofleriaceae bacterium]
MLAKVGVAAAIAAIGCSTHYTPRTPNRIAVVMDAGKPAYMRDGILYPHGLLGGGLVDAVAGNPGAEDAANEYRSRVGTGLVVGLLGLGCLTVASSIALANAVEEGNQSNRTTGWVALGCAIATIAGMSYGISAEPYRWDAVNIFNDTQAPPQLPGPPGMSRRMSMQMPR